VQVVAENGDDDQIGILTLIYNICLLSCLGLVAVTNPDVMLLQRCHCPVIQLLMCKSSYDYLTAMSASDFQWKCNGKFDTRKDALCDMLRIIKLTKHSDTRHRRKMIKNSGTGTEI